MKKYLEQADHPVIAIDAIILDANDNILLTRRNVEPEFGNWSVVGERIKVSDDSIEHAVKRGAMEECNIEVEVEYLVDVLANPRIKPMADPRFYVVQIVYVARMTGGKLKATNEASEFKWVSLKKALKESLAFNHKQILQIYQEKKNNNKLIPAAREKFTDFYGKPFSYTIDAFPRMAVDNIIFNDKQEILLAKRSQWPYVDHWDFPGGHILVNEAVKDCAKREAKEEINIDVEIGDLFHVYSDKGQSPKFMNIVVFYFSKIIKGNWNFEINVEMSEYKFFPLDKLPDKIAQHHDRALKDIKKYLKNN